ncbi:MAG: protoporphyrinogen oxidase [Myxococcota bacterium]|nr:protoporphyrinogen oxidase [Myxococcota bacterium]
MIAELDVAVVGGGISGLSAAFALVGQAPELALSLIEGSPRLGGCVRTERGDGFVIEAGPDSFLRTKPDAAALCAELGMKSELIEVLPGAHAAYLVRHGALERLPAGMVLSAPTRLGPLLDTPLLSFPGKLRALGDLLIPAKKSGEDESIESFLTRRFGAEVAKTIGAPLLGGIYAGDIGELSLHATFPQLSLFESRSRSVILGMLGAALQRGGDAHPSLISLLKSWIRTRSVAAPSPFLSLRDGLESMVDRLVERIGRARIRVDHSLIALERDGGRFVLRTSRGTLSARAVVLTLPAPVAAAVVPEGRLSRELAAIRYASTATAAFAFSKSELGRELDGSGFLVPPGEGKILAATWVTSKWPGRAPEGSILVRAYVGPGRDLDLPDSDLVELARSELERLSGPFGAPLFSRLYRHRGIRPQPGIGHRERLERLDTELAQLPGLFLAGAGYDGVGIPDCIRQAKSAARAALSFLNRASQVDSKARSTI